MKQSLHTYCLSESKTASDLNVPIGKWFYKLQPLRISDKSIYTNTKCVSVCISVL